MKQRTLSRHEMIMKELNYKTIGGSLLGLFSVVFSFLCGGKKKPKQTCKNCRFNCEDDHTCMNDCNVGSYYADKGLNRICYEGELWEGK